MDAKTARSMAKEACIDDINEISSRIQLAAMNGFTQLQISPTEIKDGTKAWIIENGYDLILHNIDNHTIYQIKWD